jgi:hypothetical protein
MVKLHHGNRRADLIALARIGGKAVQCQPSFPDAGYDHAGRYVRRDHSPGADECSGTHPTRRDAERLEASPVLADRGLGKGTQLRVVGGEPLDLESAELLRWAVTPPLPVRLQHDLHVLGQGGLKVAFCGDSAGAFHP